MKYLACAMALALAACTGTVPASYTPQSIVRIGTGAIEVGKFGYAPAQSGKVAPNQLQNTAMGKVVIGANVSDFVRRATALELERAGLELLNAAPYRVEGDVQRFMLDDLGYSVDWNYAVRYRLVETAGDRTIIDQVYASPQINTGKFGSPSDYTPSLNQMIIPAAEKFMEDMRKTGLFEPSVTPPSS